MDTKERVRTLLDQLPDDCTMEQVQYHLYVIERIERGLAEADAGLGIPHEQVARELREKWLLPAEQ